MIRLLVVEDSQAIQKTIEASLVQYRLDMVSTLKEAKTKLAIQTYQLAIFDVVLPDGNAFEFIQAIRMDGIKLPLMIFLTSKGALQDKLMGFELGGVDYITKPFEPLELKARVASLLKTSIESLVKGDVTECGDLRLDLMAQKVFRNTSKGPSEITLTPVEFKLLHFFSKHPGEVVRRDRLLDSIWGTDIHITDRTVDTHVSNLRKKIKDSSCQIQPIYGEGYRFELETIKKS